MGSRNIVTSALVLGGVIMAAGTRAAPRAQVVETQFPTEDVVIAIRILNAPGNDADATALLQDAIDATADEGGGVVFLRPQRFRIDGRLTIKEGVTLRGDGGGCEGTVLALHAGKGEPDALETITLQRGSGIRDLALWHPEQSHEAPVPYPWTIRTSRDVGGDNTTVANVTLVNPYKGISIGPEWNELHTIRNVSMTPLHTGIFIDTTTDIGRLVGVDMSSLAWENSGLPGRPEPPYKHDMPSPFRNYLRRNATGAVIGRSDWEFIDRLTVKGLETGVVFVKGERGTTNAVMYECDLYQCETALRIEHLNGIGLCVTGGRLFGYTAAIEALDTFGTVAQFHSCDIGAVGTAPVRLAGKGLLSFQQCSFGGEAPAVDATAGQVSLLNCTYDLGAPYVRAGESVTRVRVCGTGPGGAADHAAILENHSTGADIGVTAAAIAPLAELPERTLPDTPMAPRRPAAERLWRVTDSGADPAADDNTAAFQRALDAAGAAGGGTVYVPAGLYRLAGGITVPTGVELRGCFDVPHHTISAGSVLMPLGGRGEEDGAPFIRLRTGAGLRGLTVWYPEQHVLEPVPYPWTVRGLGPRCWLIDVTIGNAWQAVDLWTHESTGHVVQYLAGAMFRRGLWISKSNGRGSVADLQFNPHYALRLHRDLPRPNYGNADTGGRLINYQREHLDAMVFGRCADEVLERTFLYAAFDGLAFRDDNGGANARVFVHGTDTGSRGVTLESVGPKGVDFVLAQLVPLGNWAEAAILTEPTFSGRARFVNSQVWAGPATAILRGRGEVQVHQMNTLSGLVIAEGGTLAATQISFARGMAAHVRAGPGVERVAVTACRHPRGALKMSAEARDRCRFLANAADVYPQIAAHGPATIGRGWEPGEPQPPETPVVAPAGGVRAVEETVCHVIETEEAHSGTCALRLAGRATSDHSFAYYRILDGPIAVYPDSVLSYWVKPLNDRGRNVAVDAAFTQGLPLRDRGVTDTQGRGTHPGIPKGPVGEWTEIRIPLGRFTGQVIPYLMVAHDRRAAPGDFAALIDDVRLASELARGGWEAEAIPPGGSHRAPLTVRLGNEHGSRFHYTLDGTNPTAESPTSNTVTLPGTGVFELRYTPALVGDKIGPLVFSELYEVVE